MWKIIGLSEVVRRAMITAVLLSSGACKDVTQPADLPPSSASAQYESRDPRATRMEATLDQLTRSVAHTLADSTIRHRVYAALQASPYPERKLHFRDFLSPTP